ncbi:molybdenum cofactor guanylyltransferase MobA [Pseudomonas sp. ZM23]|uniref:Molybdenum cofactor guanylyltransferase n=1 Tax=Pseudomonas triclosanedens TaxID=2961893 RepID=A0ABY6ZVD6_9PSED|nr:molybdenum cofactor guanylyltransferase MobA [Pseudomonas triclosanedens]MCP8466670.1 molybdenum cofactor guanylyltransferase MobA [Pseudomonas triclosanedens]MCP8471975.1 molybdenum cofactor guanylyltransferase MobA [Pseudomonas triclosanedens]MCP8474641.1 molybdenum cofactor guanylyltransferase MobA [Pseudomonas triclosanedens]WAI47985.1 molybdenum cofactor guanylyltransferase MobA [Pseudomonas triclosanedens]
MPQAPLPACSVLILAGGRGQRMGGQDKGLIPWRGQPLVSYAAALVRPLSDDLIISCNRNPDEYALFADRLVHDDSPDYPGPLAGIRAGLSVARHSHLLVLPCDAPMLDGELLERLLRAAAASPDDVQMLRSGDQWEPLFSVIPVALRSPIEDAWRRGERSPRHVFSHLGLQAVDCPANDPRLANLNTPELLCGAR